jgi:hypothetical protein
MVTLEPPELVKVAGADWVPSVCTEPKLKLDGLTVNAPAVTPVPESAAVSVGLEASLVMVRLELAAPVDFGANTTLNAWLFPA